MASLCFVYDAMVRCDKLIGVVVAQDAHRPVIRCTIRPFDRRERDRFRCRVPLCDALADFYVDASLPSVNSQDLDIRLKTAVHPCETVADLKSGVFDGTRKAVVSASAAEGE